MWKWITYKKNVLFFATINMFAIWWYAIITKTPIDGAITTTYATIVVVYGASEAAKKIKGAGDGTST